MLDHFSLFDFTAWYLVFLVSTAAHEGAHALAALKLGDDTAYRGGQATLDPTPHMKREPFGMVIVPILSYVLGGWMIGWASAPYNPEWALRNPRSAGLMALAGPAANLVLLLAAAAMIHAGMAFGWFDAPDSISFVRVAHARGEGIIYLAAVLLSLMFSLNLLLFAFNLVPLPPLDGSSAPLVFLSESAAEKYWAFLRTPGVAIFGMVVAWNAIGPMFQQLHKFAVNLLYPGVHYW
jgi:Zn-dependent protease